MDRNRSIVEFLSRLRRLSVRLFVEDGQLRCSAFTGVVTPSIREELAARKSEILAFLKETNSTVATDPITPVAHDGALPLSSAQKRLWLLNQLEPGNFAYNIPAYFTLEGNLDIDILRTSLEEIVRRHEVLRTCYLNVDGQPVAKIVAAERLRLRIIDLEGISVDQQQADAGRIAHLDSIKPFRLDRAPLLRVTVLRFAHNRHVLLLTVSHIAFDGWSLGVLVTELSTLYTAGVRRQESPLAELAIQYADFAVWQQKTLQGDVLQSQLGYARKSLVGPLPVLELPADHMRPAQQTGNGGSVFFEIPRSVTDDLKTLGQRESVTLFVTLFAVFSTLLMRYSRQEDILVGTPVANRGRTELEPLIGLFVNTLVLRADLSGNPACRDFLHRIHAVALEAYAHQDVSFEKLVEVLNPERDTSRSPIFQTMFSLEQSPLTRLELPGLKPVWPEIRSTGAQFDLALYLTETNHCITGRFSFNSDIFEQATISRMKEHFLTLVTEFIRDPQQRINETPMLSESERKQLLSAWSRSGETFPRVAGIHELVECAARRRPDAIAVECGQQGLTYRELILRSDQLAGHLQSLGAGPESLVGVSVERSVDMAVALLATLKAGAAYLPLDPAFPEERLAFMLEDARPAVLIIETGRLGALPEHEAAVVSIDSFTWSAEARGPDPTSFERAYVLYTSGSQGKPKGVEISHRALVNFLTAMQSSVGIDENDVLLSVTTFSFDIFGLELWLPLTTGARTVIVPSEICRDGMLLAHSISASAATLMQATPNTWQMLLESGWAGHPQLRILCGGEAWSKPLALRLLPKCAALWNMYGPTETTIWSSVRKVEADGEVLVGGPIANTQFYVVNTSFQLQPTGVPGELLIGGEGLARGYLNRRDLSQERFIPNPFVSNPDALVYRTGDLVRTRADGTLEFLSRLDDQLKLRGFRIEPGEIETLLRASSAIEDAVVVLKRDDEPRLAAYCVRSKDSTVAAADLRRLLSGKLPGYMIPAEFTFLRALPLTPNGKVNRQGLMALPRAPREAKPIAEEVGDQLEKQLVALWEKVLRVHPIYPSDNFFELGGHSFTAVQLMSEVQKLTGKRLPLTVLFRAATVKSLAEIIRREDGVEWPLLVPIRDEGSKSPLFLIHGAEGNLLLYRQLIHHLDRDRPVYGLQSQGLNGEDPLLDSIEEMARKYVDQIIAAEPQGPYVVGGYCLGGMIALEVAQQLVAAGREVDQVIMLETYNTLVNSSVNLRGLDLWRWLQNIGFHLSNVAIAKGAERRRFLRQKMDIARARFEIHLRALRHNFRKRNGNNPFGAYPHLAVKRVNDQAASRYSPARYRGRVAVIRPKRYFTGFDSPSFGWDQVIGQGLEVYEIPVYPKGMLVEPFCRLLAEVVTRCLNASSEALGTSSEYSSRRTDVLAFPLLECGISEDGKRLSVQ